MQDHDLRKEGVIRALLIEDNPTDADLLQEILETKGSPKVEVRWAERLSEGVKLLENERFDIVLLDLSLPDSSSLETLRKTRAAAPDMPILILTGLADRDVGLTAVKEGAQDYLIKGQPNGESLHRAIRYAIERKCAERQLRESGARAQEFVIEQGLTRQRIALLEQRQEFVAMLAHDLKTPVIASERIFGLILEGAFGQTSSDLNSILVALCKSNKSMLHLIDNVMDCYRLESNAETLAGVEINVESLISLCVSEMEPLAAERKVTLTFTVADRMPNILGDHLAMRRVLCNLISNAIKFTASGGAIRIAAFDRDGLAILQVIDNGIGIDAKHLENVFDRFFQSERKFRANGMGLGLYLCRLLMNGQGGKIICRSEIKKGTTFEVTMPYFPSLPAEVLAIDAEKVSLRVPLHVSPLPIGCASDKVQNHSTRFVA